METKIKLTATAGMARVLRRFEQERMFRRKGVAAGEHVPSYTKPSGNFVWTN